MDTQERVLILELAYKSVEHELRPKRTTGDPAQNIKEWHRLFDQAYKAIMKIALEQMKVKPGDNIGLQERTLIFELANKTVQERLPSKRTSGRTEDNINEWAGLFEKAYKAIMETALWEEDKSHTTEIHRFK